MPAYKPEECYLLLSDVMEADDIDSALDLYEPEAIFIVSPGKVVIGRAAIREVLQGVASAQATGKLDPVTSVTSADGSLAFTRTKGTSTLPGPDGNLITTHFHSVEGVRKQDGTWRIVIDDPCGEGLG